MSDWKYDAVEDHPMVARRIPVIRSTYPQWRYELAVCIGDPGQDVDYRVWDGQDPTPEEWDLIESAIGYRMSYYRPGWAAQMRAAHPFDIDGTTNTVILMKRTDDGWCYRRDSWEHDAVPGRDDLLDLRAILDRVFGFAERPFQPWEDWKAGRPDLWPSQVAS